MTPEERDQKLFQLVKDTADATAEQVLEKLGAKLEQTSTPTYSPSKEELQEWVIEALSAQVTEPAVHHLCQDQECEPCRAHDNKVAQHYVEETNRFYEEIPGVSEIKRRWLETQQRVRVIPSNGE